MTSAGGHFHHCYAWFCSFHKNFEWQIKARLEMHFAIDEDWNCQVIFTLTSISINSTLSQTYNFIPNSSIFYPWMHEKFQQSASISIFSTTITVIFLPSFFDAICLRQFHCDEHIEYVRVQIVNWKSWDIFCVNN